MVAIGLVLVVGTALAAWWALHGVPRRGLWVTSVAVLAIVGGSVLADAAPPSIGVLEQRLDHLVLPFYEVVAEEHAGASTCRPRCPRIVRKLRAPVGSLEAAAGEVRAAIARHPELPPLSDDGWDGTGEDVHVAVAFATGVDDGITVVDVEITLAARAGL